MPQTNTDQLKDLLTLLKSPKGKHLSDTLEASLLKAKRQADAQTARVESAVALDENTKSDISEAIKNKFENINQIDFVINKQVLGGLKITIQDKLFDLSLSHKLATFAI